MANIIGEYVSGCSDFSLAVMRSILLVLCGLAIVVDIVLLFFQDSVGGVMITLVDCLIVSFGAIGAYKKKYKFLMLFAGAYLIFGTVILLLSLDSQSTYEERQKMFKNRSIAIVSLILGFMALFMAYNYHSKESRNDAHAGRQLGVNHPASIIDVYVGDQTTSGQVYVRQMDNGQRQHMPPPSYEYGQMQWPVDGKQSLSSHQNASKIDTKSKF